jgi:hypothetical protein
MSSTHRHDNKGELDKFEDGDKSKLNGIEAGATKVEVDAQNADITPGGITSATYQDITGASVTTVGAKSKAYSIAFTAAVESDTNNKFVAIQLVIDGGAIPGSEREIEFMNAGDPMMISLNHVAALLAPGKVIKVQAKITAAATVTLNSGTLTIMGVG